MDINEFYERVLSSLDVEVSKGYLMINDGDRLVNYTDDGVPLVLPTKNHIRTMLDEDADGEIIVTKKLYNPLDETIIKGDSLSLSKTKSLVTTRLNNKFTVLGSLLLTMASDSKFQTKSTMLLNQFLVRLQEAMNPGIKKIVDANTISKWLKIYDNSFEAGSHPMFKVYVKKGGRIGSKRYNRVTTFKSPVYEELLGMSKGGRINGVTLRNKDITIFKIIFEYLIENINSKGIVTIGSNDKECPGFISLYTLYNKVMTKFAAVRGDIDGVDSELEDGCVITLTVDSDELTNLGIYKRALASIPTESDLVKTKLGAPTNAPVMQEPVREMQVDPNAGSTDSTADAIRTALYGNVSGVANPPMQMQPQMPVQYQQQPTQPMMQQPMYPQQQMPMQMPVQQPVYQNPQQQQPMYPQQQMQPVSIGAVGEVRAFGNGMQQQQPMQPNAWGR